MSSLQILHQRFCEDSRTFKGNTPRTIKWLHSNFSDFLNATQVKTIDQITVSTIKHWILIRKANNRWSAKTVRNALQSMSLFLDWCIQNGFITENPARQIQRPKLPQVIPRHLPYHEALALLDWAEHFPYYYSAERSRSTAILATFIYTGIRMNELLQLRLTHVDLVQGTLFVKDGKGMKDRLIPLHSHLIPYLKAYLNERKALGRTCPYFFTGLRRDTPITEASLRRLVTKLRKKSGIHFYPHLLRHTFAVLMLQGGCDIYSLSKMMGHSNITTTTRYLSTTVGFLKEQIQKHSLGQSKQGDGVERPLYALLRHRSVNLGRAHVGVPHDFF